MATTKTKTKTTNTKTPDRTAYEMLRDIQAALEIIEQKIDEERKQAHEANKGMGASTYYGALDRLVYSLKNEITGPLFSIGRAFHGDHK